MSQLLEDLRAKEESDQEAAAKRWRQIVCSLAADGDGVELADVQQLLAATGKSADELSSDVSQQKRRYEKVAKVRAAADAQAELPNLREQIEAADRALELAKKTRDQIVRPLQHRIQDISTQQVEAFHLRQELLKGSPDPDVTERLSTVRWELKMAHRRADEQLEVVERRRTLLSSEKARQRPGASQQWLRQGEQYGGDPEKVARLTEQVASASAELMETRRSIEELLSREAAILNEMLES